MSPTITLARPEDLITLLPLVQEFHKEGHLPYDKIATVQAVESLIKDLGLGRIYLIYSGEDLSGYVAMTCFHSIEFGGSCLFYDEIYLRPSLRGRGVGTDILHQIIELCRTEGLRAFFLEVDPENAPAQKLYRRVGFKPRPYTLEYLILRPVVDDPEIEKHP